MGEVAIIAGEYSHDRRSRSVHSNKGGAAMNYVKTKNFSFEDILKNEFASGIVGQSARHHLAIYRRSLQKSKPIILELGTNRGKSTTAFLRDCRERDGRLFSVDIADCSAVSNDSNWHFICNDSTDMAGKSAHVSLRGSWWSFCLQTQ